MAKRMSGVQQDVLALYRKVLRGALRKDRAGLDCRHREEPADATFVQLLHAANSSTTYAANEFRKQAASVPRSNFKKIEYMMRKGEKQLKLLDMPGVRLVRGSGS